jgi:HTH-type transcriptional regulator, sugar sensing transcriptional regulator
MQPEEAAKELMGFDLSEKEVKVYMYLSQKGSSKAGDIAKALTENRTDTYKTLRNLENKGVLEASINYPTEFSAIPLDKALSILINAQKERVKEIERRKADLLNFFKQEKIEISVEKEEKIQIIKGIDQIYAGVTTSLEEGALSLQMVIPQHDLIREYTAGMLDLLNKFSKKVDTHLITNLKDANHEVIKELDRLDIDWASVDSGDIPYYMMIDDELVIMTKPRGKDKGRKDFTAFWTNNYSIVKTFKIFFQDLWRKGKEVVAEENRPELDYANDEKEEVAKALRVYNALRSLKDKPN